MKKGFTLIELLIVLGILAVLAAAVVVVINPAELLAQGRDTHRVTDLTTLKKSIDLYIIRTTGTISLGTNCFSGSLAYHIWNVDIPPPPSPGQTVTSQYQPFVNSGFFGGVQSPTQVSAANLRSIAGNGWVPVAFTSIAGGSPISKLPIDPVNLISLNTESSLAIPINPTDTTPPSHFYAYQCNQLAYEFNANMESVKYGNGGSKDLESTDGGIRARHNGALAGAGCVDGVPPAFATCYGSPLTPSYIANLIYEVGSDPGLDL